MSHPPTNKHNYIEIVNRGVPEYYREADYALYGSEEDISLAFLGNILKAALHNDLLFDVSGKTKEEVAEFFVPEKKTYVTSRSFEDKILVAYGLSLDDFATKSDLVTWVSSTLLPDIELNAPTGFYSQLSSYAFGTYSSIELVHEYLLEHLGLFYILDTSTLQGGSASSCGSAVMVEYFVNGFYGGGEATEQQALNALFRFFWENREGSTFYGSFFPQMFSKTSAQISGDPYLSGTQMFDSIQAHLETWTDQRLKDHEFFKASLSALLTNTGVFPTKLRDAGPFQRFLKAISLGIADASLLIEELADLLSIDECPEKFLELLANNIGWQLLTGDYQKWRAQLRNAVLLYKSKGSVLGLEAACKLIFPDGIFEASSVVETWESYIPKMLYYMIKTSSFIAKEGLEFEDKAITFEGSWPEDVRFNQAPKTFINAKDTNYRFLVDGILERFHNRYEGILINGVDFRTLPMWDCLPTVNGQRGFAHRNYPENNSQFLVAVPPWEKYGFYKECEVDEDRLDFFCKILSGSREEFGFEVDQYIVDEFRTLVLTQLNKVYALSGDPIYSENNKFRFFTEEHQLPPNYSSFVTYGNASSLEDFDTWNTKGSHLFATFDANAIEYTVGGYDTFKNKAALETYRDVLRQFVPLHAVVRILLYLDLEDESFTSGTLCIFTDECLDEYNTNYLHSRRENFWAGASGGGNLGTTYVNGDGRILPVFSAGDFWNVDSNVLDRNTSRRRNYRYSLECYPYTRMGKGMPVAMNHYKPFDTILDSTMPPVNSNLSGLAEWTAGSGDIGAEWEAVSEDAENVRELRELPYGGSGIVWVARDLDTATNAEGGFNSSSVAVDASYDLRFSVWAKSDLASNSLYFGPLRYMTGTSTATCLSLNGSTVNPYFINGLDFSLQDDWYLVVGHVQASGTSIPSTTRPDSGIYDVYGKKVKDIDFDFIFNPGASAIGIRAFHYWNPAGNGDEIELWDPRIDVLDENAPSLQELLKIGQDYILKGFEYDKQSYLPPSSIVWDNSGFYNGVGCEPVQQSGDSDLSSLYPVRGVSETDYECSSLPIYRDTMKGVMEVMVHRRIAEDKFFDFSDMNYRSFEFGNSVHESYHIYKNEFSSVLKNTISPNYPYYGGKNFIAHAFGPTIWNSDFRYKGKITTNIGGLSGAALPGAPTVFSFGYEPQWEYVFGGTDSAGIKYKNFQNSSIEISNRPFFKAAPNTASDTESGVSRDRGLLKTREALSGIEIHQPYDNSKSFAVVNSKDRDLYNGALETSVSLYNTDGRSLEVVVPLDPEFATGSFYGALRPQSKQRVDVYARTRHNRHDTDIHISLCTSGLTDNDGNPVDWYFSWEESKWIPYDMGRPEEFVKVLDVSRYEPCILPYSAKFHTQDSLTVKDIPCVSAIRDEVHTSTTKYLLKVSNGTAVTPNGFNSLATEALTISEISIIDTELNSSMNRYDSSAIDRIYTFWDGLSHGKYSRNIADASGYFEDEGGSRAEYIELVGGVDYTRNTTISGKTVLEFGVED